MAGGAGLHREAVRVGEPGCARFTGSGDWEVLSRQSRGWAASLNWIRRPGGPEDCSHQLQHQGTRCSVHVASVPVLGAEFGKAP